MTDLLTRDPVTLRRELGLLTEAEVAAVAEVEIRTVQTWRTERTGPPFTRIGRQVFYRQEVVEQWLKEREEETQP